MLNHTKWRWLFAPALLMGAAASSAAIYSASATTGGPGTAGCIGSRACTDPGWGIDLNDNAGYRWSVPGGSGGPAQLFIKGASFSGERRMSLWVNNSRISTIILNSSTAPRPGTRRTTPGHCARQPVRGGRHTRPRAKSGCGQSMLPKIKRVT